MCSSSCRSRSASRWSCHCRIWDIISIFIISNMSPIPDSPCEVSILCFLQLALWRIPVWRTCWFANDDCAAVIASQLREGVPSGTVVVGEDSGTAITAACISVTSSLTSTAPVLLFSSSSLSKTFLVPLCLL